MKNARVVIVTNIISPYRLPMWEALSHMVGELQVFFCAETDPNRIWKIEQLDRYTFKTKVLSGKNLFFSKLDWGVYLNPTIFQELSNINPTHIVVTGYEAPSYLAAITFAKYKNIPLTIWYESHAMSSRFRSGLIAWIRRKLLKLADTCVTSGTLATNYLVSMGIPRERIVTGINTVDVQRIDSLLKDWTECEDPQVSPTPVRFLYVGQFIERKGVIELLHAFKNIDPDIGVLTLVGYGPLEEEIRRLIVELNLQNVRISGATKTLDETVDYLTKADVLVMPSLREVWGLVVNEALAAGLFVLSSIHAGVTHDLVLSANEKVGIAIDPNDHDQFVEQLKLTCELFKQGLVEKEKIRRWGQSHTPEKCAKAICKALLLGEKQQFVDSRGH